MYVCVGACKWVCVRVCVNVYVCDNLYLSNHWTEFNLAMLIFLVVLRADRLEKNFAFLLFWAFLGHLPYFPLIFVFFFVFQLWYAFKRWRQEFQFDHLLNVISFILSENMAFWSFFTFFSYFLSATVFHSSTNII